MKVNSIKPVFESKNITISREINKEKTFLYNEVLNIIQETPVPALFSNETITISSPATHSLNRVVERLNKAGIKFDVTA